MKSSTLWIGVMAETWDEPDAGAFAGVAAVGDGDAVAADPASGA